MSHFLIIGNGDFLPKSIILKAAIGKTIIALDGAINKLSKINIKPHIVLGDFDSIKEGKIIDRWGIKSICQNPEFLDNKKHDEIEIVFEKNQNITDFVKAIRYCDKQEAKSITSLCVTGGRIDHHEGALRALRTEYKKDRVILIHTAKQTLQYLRDEEINFEGKKGDKCGILAFPKGSFSSSGLCWNGDNYPLEFGYSESICNYLVSTSVKITVAGEALVVMPQQL
jgi:thiamine pyrophosphokinase